MLSQVQLTLHTAISLYNIIYIDLGAISSRKVGLWMVAVPPSILGFSLGLKSSVKILLIYYLFISCSDTSGGAGQEGDSMEEGELESE